jgi:hypothetical protein
MNSLDILHLQNHTSQKYPALGLALLHHRNTRNEPMVFQGSEYLMSLYRDIQKYHRLVLEKSTQSGVSEMLILQAMIEALENWTILYTLPKISGRDRFYSNRIKKQHGTNPFYRQLIGTGNEVTRRISMVKFGPGTILFSGSNDEASFLEVPCDSIFVDEFEQANQENLLLLEERLS